MDRRSTTNCKNKKLILEAMKLAEKMLLMSEQGVVSCNDDSCWLLFGVIRDCGYKIRRTIEEEQFEELFDYKDSQLVH